MNVLRKTVLSTISFGAGYAWFADVWEENSVHLNTKKIQDQDTQALASLIKTPLYQQFEKNPQFNTYRKSTLIPKSHQTNHVPLGLLFGPTHLSVDPIAFQNESKDELYFFYHLGKNLTDFDNTVHNGIISTLLDEALCLCAFSKLPSERGVTGKLSANFLKEIEPGSNILISCKIKEIKGRKCIIEGDVKQLTSSGKAKVVTTAECTLIEPKWFKYFNWVPAF